MSEPPPEPEDRRANKAELTAALWWILESQAVAKIAVWKAGAVRRIRATFKDQRPCWITVFTPMIDTLANRLASVRNDPFPAAITSACTEINAGGAYLRSEVTPVGAMAQSTIGGLSGFLGDALAVIDAALSSWDTELQDAVKAAGNSIKLIKVRHDNLVTADAELAQSLGPADESKNLAVQAGLAPLAVAIDGCVTAARVLLNKKPEAFLADVDAAIIQIWAPASEQQFVTLLTPILVNPADGREVQAAVVRRTLRLASPDRLALLVGISNKAFAAMMNTYGLPWIVVMMGFDDPVQTLILKRCSVDAYPPAIIKRVPPGTATAGTLGDILSRVGADPAAKDFDVIQSLYAGDLPAIALPPKVTANGWTPVAGIRVPAAFTVGTMSTDPVCLKHIAEELGDKPDIAKFAAYFAELVDACLAAKNEWVKAGKPAQLECQIAQAVGKWRIIIKMFAGAAEIFHVDSGYGKSAWRTA